MTGVLRRDGAGEAIDRVGGQSDDAARAQGLRRALDDGGVGVCGVHAHDLLAGDGRGRRERALAHRHEHARAACEVLAHLDRCPATLRAHEIGRRAEVALVELAAKHAARGKRAWREVDEAAEHVQPVGATVERELGLVVLDLSRNLVGEHVGRDVGRIAHQDREGPHKVGIDARGEVALDDIHRAGKPERVAVADGEVDCRRREVGGRDLRALALVGDGERDTARAAADLEDPGRDAAGGLRGSVDALERGVHQDLGLGAGDEDAPLAAQDDVAKRGLARHVLEGLSGGTALDRGAHARALVRGERAVVVHIEIDPREAHDVAEQPLGRQPRVLVPVPLQKPAGPVDDLFDGPGFLCACHCSLPARCVIAS